MITALFSYLYIDSIVGLGDVTVEGLLENAKRLRPAELLELYRHIAQMAGKPFH